MHRRLAAVFAFLMFAMTMQAQLPHPVPKVRASLSEGDWFPFVFSKMAPLENWNVVLSAEDIRRDRYDSDLSFQQAKADTYVIPRFCFHFFRIQPESYARLGAAVRDYRGPVLWQFYNNCIGAFAGKWTGYPPIMGSNDEFQKKLEEAIRNPPKPDPELVRKATEDIPRFCQYLESQLGLTDKEPLEFDKSWLTWEGLQTSRPMFDDFVERGDHMPTLARTYGAESSRRLRFGVSREEMDSLLSELGADYSLADNSDVAVAPQYPLLSRLSDIASGAAYRAEEINGLLGEIMRARTVAKQPMSVRALDKLHRIAKLAERDNISVFFNGQ